MKTTPMGRAGWSRAISPFILSVGWLTASSVVGCVSTADDTSDDPDRDVMTVGGNDPAGGCTQGQQVGCPCGGGQPDGIQVCNAANAWDACQCAGMDAGTGGMDAGTGGMGAGTGGMGAGTGGMDAGTGGSDPGDPCSSPVTDMIADVEEVVAMSPPMLNAHDTRQGPWWSDSGTGASITGANSLGADIPDGRCTSTRAIHADGDSASSHAVFGFNFNSTGGTDTPYSVAGNTGVAFFAKGTGSVRVELTTTNLHGDFDCAGMGCFGFYGSIVELSAEWTLIQIPFDTMEQPNWAQMVSLDKANAIGLQFQLQGVADVWIDDVGFY